MYVLIKGLYHLCSVNVVGEFGLQDVTLGPGSFTVTESVLTGFNIPDFLGSAYKTSLPQIRQLVPLGQISF
jgi:hypothetical protein